MVYRKNNGKLGFNYYDFEELMQLQFDKADSIDEIELIKDVFNGIINQVSNNIAYKNKFIQKKKEYNYDKKEKSQQTRPYNKYGY